MSEPSKAAMEDSACQFIEEFCRQIGFDCRKVPLSQLTIIAMPFEGIRVTVTLAPTNENIEATKRSLKAIAATETTFEFPPVNFEAPFVLGEDCKVTPAVSTIRMPDGEIRLVCPSCNQWAFREGAKGWERIDRYGNIGEHGTVYSRRELGQSGNPDDILACCAYCQHEWVLTGRALEIALKGRNHG